MKAEVSMSQLYWNKNSIMKFFFRSQAEETFEEVMSRIAVEDKEDALDKIDDYFVDVDDCEETFYSESVEDIIEMIGLPVIDSEEEGDE